MKLYQYAPRGDSFAFGRIHIVLHRICIDVAVEWWDDNVHNDLQDDHYSNP